MSNNYKSQYKQHAGAAWTTQLSGSEMGAFKSKEDLAKRYPFTRVLDPDGRVVG